MNDTSTPLPLTVVIPAYNRADLVGRAVESARRQRPRAPAEIMVVDDCSADDTGAAAAAAGATVLRHERNQGEAGARNSGMEAAAHDWVAFLDSDDEWLPGHLDQLWPRRQGHVVLASSALSTSPTETRLLGHPATRPKTITTPRELVFPGNPVPLSGTMADRRVLLELGGFRPWKTGADLDMWIRALSRGSLLVCPEPGFRYHVHAGQVSSDGDLMHRNLIELLNTYSDEPWWTARLVESVAVINAWDELQTARRAGDRVTVRHLQRWLLAQPRRVLALMRMWMWRYLVRRRMARLRAGAPLS